MGDLSFLVPSFSQSSSDKEEKGNPLQRALTSSISFGRFMSESLDWEKWSAFTQNRHLEEVERYSKPGSVAEKTAYFEAQFKRRRAEALLAQQNASANDFSDTNTENTNGNNCSVQSAQSLNMAVRQSCPCEPSRILDDSCNGGVENATVPAVLVGNPLEINDVESDGSRGDDIVRDKEVEDATEKVMFQEDSITRILSSSSGKKHEIFSCAPCAGQIMPVQLKNSEKTPDTNNNMRDSSNKRRSYTTSLHINFSSSGGIPKAIPPCSKKAENSTRVVRAPPKNYKPSNPPPNSTRASMNDISTNHSSFPTPESSRTLARHGDPMSRSRTEVVKSQSSSAKYSQTSNKFGSNVRSSTPVSSFTFKTEERAERRKEFYQKLEKLRSKEADKQQVHPKSQLKARSNSKDLRNSLVLKAAKKAEVPPIAELPSICKKEVAAARPCFPKVEERAAALKVQDVESRPPRRLQVKTGGTKIAYEKNNHLAIYSGKHPPMKSRNENASPNITSRIEIEEPEHCL